MPSLLYPRRKVKVWRLVTMRCVGDLSGYILLLRLEITLAEESWETVNGRKEGRLWGLRL